MKYDSIFRNKNRSQKINGMNNVLLFFKVFSVFRIEPYFLIVKNSLYLSYTLFPIILTELLI